MCPYYIYLILNQIFMYSVQLVEVHATWPGYHDYQKNVTSFLESEIVANILMH